MGIVPSWGLEGRLLDRGVGRRASGPGRARAPRAARRSIRRRLSSLGLVGPMFLCAPGPSVAAQPLAAAEDEGGASPAEEGAEEARSEPGDEGFDASAYVGFAVDSFAAPELRKYLNPEASGGTEGRLVAGFNFDYRLTPTDRVPALWVFGETLHGMRSAEFDCSEETGNADSDLCKAATAIGGVPPPSASLAILRNASSLEAFVGLRLELLSVGSKLSGGVLYLTGRLGFVSVKDGGGDALDEHFAGVGVIASGGRFAGSYLEVGGGRSQVFMERPNRRFKIDAFLTLAGGDDPTMSPFVQMIVDTDLSDGPDTIQTFFGVDFDLAKVFAGR